MIREKEAIEIAIIRIMDIVSAFLSFLKDKSGSNLWPTCDVTPQIPMIPTWFLLNRVKVVFAAKNKKNVFRMEIISSMMKKTLIR